MKKYSFSLICLILASVLAAGCRHQTSQKKEEIPAVAAVDTIPCIRLLDICIDSLETEDHLLKSGENLSAILGNAGLTPKKIDEISEKSKGIFDLRKMKAGQQYTLVRDSTLTRLYYFIYRDTPTEYVVFDLRDSVAIYNYHKKITNIPKTVTGTITSSLWNAIHESGTDPLLAIHLADIFAWQIDFFGIAKGDWFKVAYDQACIDDSVEVEIAGIKGAVFNHMGKTYYAIPFTQDSITEYFDENGENLRKAFLKAPLKFSRISSRFTNARYHPVLKITRPHHGVDYAAPAGTPVVSIGDGTVVRKGFQPRGGGNFLVIKHNAVYSTTYMHLSRFAKGMQPGKRVRQGELIGYVGSTGLATGPHLDFRVHKNGTPVNPLTIESPSATPVRPELRDSFDLVRDRWVARLDSIGRSGNPEKITEIPPYLLTRQN